MFKIKKILALAVSACCIAAALPSAFVMADGTKVVTLGANLDDDQRTMILKFFGIYGETVDTLTITNDDEREHLGAYVPLEQIGTRTFSCALVDPTDSGGIQVKTANLTWVTSNMIASTLSTSGVVNCDVIAAAPFAVSGTGALTGVIMAYESASGETLDPAKTDAANQELVTTATIGDHIGQPEATLVVNESKEQVIEGDVIDTGDITDIVNNVTEENNITLEQDDTDLLVSLLEQIAQLDYDIQEMQETLDRVEKNSEEEITGTTEPADDSGSVDGDSILNGTDDSALGDDATIDATDPTTLEVPPETEAPATEPEEPETTDDSGLEITISDTYNSEEDGSTAEQTEAPATEAPAAEPETEAPAAEPETEAPAAEPETTDDSGLEITVSDTYNSEDDGSADAEEAPEAEPQDDLEGMISQTAPVSDGSEDADTAEEAEEEQPAEASFTVDNLEFMPDSTVEPGLNMVEILSTHTDLTAGSGTITIANADDGSVVETISMDDSSKVVSYSADDGIEYDIYLSSPLAPGEDYTVSISDDAFELDGAALQGADNVWSFDTLSSGICLEYSAAGVDAGAGVTGNVYLDPNVEGYAVIDSVTIDDADVTDSAALSQSDFTESGSFQVTFPNAGTANVHVTFYDSPDSMNYVDEATAAVVVE